MKTRSTILIPDPGADRAGRLRVGLSALAGLALGLALALAAAPASTGPGQEGKTMPASKAGNKSPEAMADRRGEPAEERTENRKPEADRKEALDIRSKDAGEIVSRAGTGPGTETTAAVETPAARQPGDGDSLRRLLPGRTAYVRCDGVELRPGPFPCPRDPKMEQDVWRVLRSLSGCPRSELGFGHADIRLDFKRGEQTSVRLLLSPLGDNIPDKDAMYECVGETLTSITTVLNPLYMVVSFQVDLQRLP